MVSTAYWAWGETAPWVRVAAGAGGDRGWLDLGGWQGACQSVAVAGGDQVDRPGSGEDQAVQHRFVAVAVHQCDLVLGDAEVTDHPVAGGVAVEDEVGAVGAEDAGGVAFRRADGAGVFEEGTEFGDGDRQVAAQQPFSK